MTTNSAIDTSNINENFPYPGISNDSQVFRDNFTAIKLSLNSAKDELEQFLTHGLRDDNLETNLNGNILSTCALRKTADYRHGITGLKDANFDLNYNNGQYQNVKIGADLTINLINFPTDTTDVKQVGKIRLQLSADATDRKVMFTAANAILKYDGEYPFVDSNKLTVKGSTGEDVTIIDIWQVNNGTLTPAIYFKYVGFFEYHTSPPATPTKYTDDVGTIQSTNSTAITTDDTTPSIIVGARLSTIPKLYVDGLYKASTYNSSTGALSPRVALPEGTYEFAYTLSDSLGNESGLSAPLTITIDTTSPNAPPKPASFVDQVGYIQDMTSNELTTDNKRPGINIGVNLAGTPKLYIDGIRIDATYDTDSTIGTFTPDRDLADGGPYGFTYTLTDDAGNESAHSPVLSITIDTTAPPTPTVAPASYKDSVGSITNNTSTATKTDDPRPGINISPNLVGTARLYVNDVPISATYESNSTVGTLRPDSNLPDNTYIFSYTLTDSAGNESGKSPGITITIDTTSPIITSVTPSWGAELDSTEITADGTLTVITSGVENGQTVTSRLNSVDYTGTSAGNTTSITIPMTDLAALSNNTSYDIVTSVSDLAGNPAITNTTSFTVSTAIDGGWYATKQIPSRRDGTNLASDRIYGIALLSGNYATVSTQFDMPGVFHGSLTYYTNNAITHQINLQDITDTWLHCTSVAIDSSNNVYIAGDITRDGFVRKYSSTGTLIWAKTLDVSTSDSWYKGYATVNVDNSDNMILVGNYGINATNVSGTNAGFIAKYNSSNVLQWARSLLKSNENTHFAQGAITSSGAMGVVGYSGSLQYIIASYSNTGNLQWKRINTQIGTANITDVSIAADSNNNFYISGTKSSDGGVSPRNAFVVKYSPTGSLLWTKALSADSYFYAIDVDSSNIIHVVGSCDGGGLYATYDASGTLLSKRVFTNLSIFSDIKVDSSNVYISYNIYLSGSEYASGVITLDRVTGNNILGTTAVDITITDASAITEFELTFTDTDATDLVSSSLLIPSFPDDTAITQTTDIELTVTGGQAH